MFEHFTCPAYVNEGWGPHSFTEMQEMHCRCGGGSVESERVIELESGDIHYKLTRMPDDEYIVAYNDNGMRIEHDWRFYWSFEDELKAKGIYLNLAQIHATLKKLCGGSGYFYDHSKGSFSFPFSLKVKKENKNFAYLFMVSDSRGSTHFNIYKLLEPDDDKYDRRWSRKPIEGEFSKKEIYGFIMRFCGYLADSFKTIVKSYDEFFFKKVEASLILYGYKDGHFFEEGYDSREEYELAVKALEKIKRKNKT